MDTQAQGTWSRVIERIARVELRVQDIDRSLAFYEGVVGIQVLEKSADTAVLAAPDGEGMLHLRSDGVTGPAQPLATGLFHTAILLPSRLELSRALIRLADAGLAIGAGDHLVSESLYIDDPDGNGVEIYRDRPREEWPPPLREGDLVALATEPVDLQALADEAMSAHVTGKEAPPGTTIGHVHLQVSDIATTVDFYRDILGFDLMARLGSQAAFLAAQGYHHHLGTNVWRSRGQKPASPDRAGLDRVVFEAAPTEVEAVKTRLEEVGHDFRDGGEISTKDPGGIELVFAPRAA